MPEWSEEVLCKVAELFYFEDKTHQAIGNAIGVSRQTVSRMLRAAREHGNVLIQIVRSDELPTISELRRSLKNQFKFLKDAVIVPLPSAILDESDIVIQYVARAAGKYLTEILTNETKMVIGPGYLVKRACDFVDLDVNYKGLQIVPMTGFIYPQNLPNEANIIASILARQVGGQHHWLPVPLLVREHELEVVNNLPIVRNTLSVMAEANVVFTSVAPYALPRLHALEDWGYFTREEFEGFLRQIELLPSRKQPAGMIAGWLFDHDGETIDTHLFRTGMDPDQMKKLVKDSSGNVILVVGADQTRLKAIEAILKGGYVNTLITDELTAKCLLGRK